MSSEGEASDKGHEPDLNPTLPHQPVLGPHSSDMVCLTPFLTLRCWFSTALQTTEIIFYQIRKRVLPLKVIYWVSLYNVLCGFKRSFEKSEEKNPCEAFNLGLA